MIRRREFITLLGGAAAWPLAARSQQGAPVRRIGVLLAQTESDPVQQSWIAAFVTRLRDLAWREGENVRIDYRFVAGDPARTAPLAKELRRPRIVRRASAGQLSFSIRASLCGPCTFAQSRQRRGHWAYS